MTEGSVVVVGLRIVRRVAYSCVEAIVPPLLSVANAYVPVSPKLDKIRL